MRDMTDAEFFDDAFEGKLKAAFDSVEPSDEAKARMLNQLLAREAQLQAETPVVQPHLGASVAQSQTEAPAVQENMVPSLVPGHTAESLSPLAAQMLAEVHARMDAEVAEEHAALTSSAKTEATVADNEADGSSEVAEPSSEGKADVAAEVHAEGKAPSRKRVIRPWQIAVPAAAAVLLGIAFVVVGPIVGMPGAGSAGVDGAPASITSESDAAKNATMAQETQSMSSSANLSGTSSSSSTASSPDMAAGSASLSSAEDVEANELGASTSSIETASSESIEQSESSSEDVTEASQAEEAGTTAASDSAETDEASQDTNYAKDYPVVVVIVDGVEYQLKISSSKAATSSDVGNFAYDATAYDEARTASITCAIYEPSTSSSETYYISYLGEETYYPAQVVD